MAHVGNLMPRLKECCCSTSDDAEAVVDLLCNLSLPRGADAVGANFPPCRRAEGARAGNDHTPTAPAGRTAWTDADVSAHERSVQQVALPPAFRDSARLLAAPDSAPPEAGVDVLVLAGLPQLLLTTMLGQNRRTRYTSLSCPIGSAPCAMGT